MDINLANANLAVTSLLLLVVIWQFFKILRLDKVRKHFYSSGLKKDLEHTLTEQDNGIAKIEASIRDLNQQTESLRTINQNNFQKIGFVKFSQFGEAGNLSFSLVLLNDHNNGIMVS